MVFVFVMTWYGHVVRNTLSAINLNNQAFNLVRPLEAGRHWLSLFPHCVWIQFRYWGSFCDMFIKDGGDVRLSYLGIPGIVGIDDDRRPLLAGTEAACRAHQHLPRWDGSLHQPHIESHQQLRRTGRP